MGPKTPLRVPVGFTGPQLLSEKVSHARADESLVGTFEIAFLKGRSIARQIQRKRFIDPTFRHGMAGGFSPCAIDSTPA